MKTAVIVGTGPSLTPEQCAYINSVRSHEKCLIFAANLAYRVVTADVLAATNKEFWDYYWEEIKTLDCDCWTPHKKTADKYGINYVEERNAPGLSTDPSYIHHHHGSGPIALNIAYHYGCRRFILIGWDMRHQGKRHYFGEYPEPLRHITRNLGPNGELIGLINEMKTIRPEAYGIEIINCTPNSALTHFPMANLEDVL